MTLLLPYLSNSVLIMAPLIHSKICRTIVELVTEFKLEDCVLFFYSNLFITFFVVGIFLFCEADKMAFILCLQIFCSEIIKLNTPTLFSSVI